MNDHRGTSGPREGSDLDTMLRRALHDLDDRAAHHVATRTAPAARPEAAPARSPEKGRLAPPRRIRSGLLPLATAAAVVAVLAMAGVLLHPGGNGGRPAPPATGTPNVQVTAPVTPPAPAPTVPRTTVRPGGGPSQSVADAARDHINGYLAQLPLSQRLKPIERTDAAMPAEVLTSTGRWVISAPDIDGMKAPKQHFSDVVEGTPEGCLEEPAGWTKPKYDTCPGYTEILHLTADGSRLLRAWPFPEIGPQWLLPTSDTMFCGSVTRVDSEVQGGMLCRIDLGSAAFRARLLTCVAAADPSDDPFCGMPTEGTGGWPGTWKLGDETARLQDFAAVQVRSSDLVVVKRDGTVAQRYDPETLVARD